LANIKNKNKPLIILGRLWLEWPSTHERTIQKILFWIFWREPDSGWVWGELRFFLLPPLPAPERFFFKEKLFQTLPPTYLLTSTYLPLLTYLPISTYLPPSYLLPSYITPFLVSIPALLPPRLHHHNR
jgi:hypothetical protein